MSGPLFMQAVREGGATLIPVDSEHNAIFQCMRARRRSVRADVRRVLLTASGGPFLRTPASALAYMSRPNRPARIRAGSWAARSRWIRPR